MYGAYPPNYLKRISWLFPEAKNILHLFSGMVEKGTGPGRRRQLWIFDRRCIRIFSEVRRMPRGFVIGDRVLDEKNNCEVREGIYDLIVSDPPYNLNYLKYGTPKVNKKKVIRECSYLVKRGGCLVWLDTVTPIWAKRDGWRQAGAIGLQQSTNHAVRAITILEKVK